MRQLDLPGVPAAPPVREIVLTAHHEAGHAIAAIACGILVLKATIERDGAVLGSVSHYTREAAPYDRAAVCLAGPLAQARAEGSGSWSRAVDNGGSRDLDRAIEALRAADDEHGMGVRFAAALGRARTIVETHEEAILSMARALLEARTLDTAAVYGAALPVDPLLADRTRRLVAEVGQRAAEVAR